MGFTITAVFAGVFRLPRGLFLAVYLALAAPFLYAFVRWSHLSPEEIAALFIAFRRERPIFSRMIARIPGWKIDSTYDEFLVLARTLRGVSFRP